MDGAPVVRGGRALDQPATLGAVDQPCDARLLELQEAGEVEHRGLAVAQDSQQAQLRDREVVCRRDLAQQRLTANESWTIASTGSSSAIRSIVLVQFVPRTHIVRVTNYPSRVSPCTPPSSTPSTNRPATSRSTTRARAASDEVVVDVLAAGLHPRVRSGANGTHYTSTGELPLIPGVDGVGRDRRRRAALLRPRRHDARVDGGADRRSTAAAASCCRADSDAATIAAAMNPAMSSWIALRRRIAIEPGQSVLVLGATGNAGQMAVQIAKHLGAGHVAIRCSR